jgi:heme-degrading monooxygenase HmoA
VDFHLAQVNIAYLRAPQDDPLLADFVARLDETNALAETSPGFVWRYVSDSRDADAREYDDVKVLFNMSVWRDIDALHQFTYRTAHAEVFAKRAKWFEDISARMQSRGVALWWLPTNELPTVADAKSRLELITRDGPTAQAFTFKKRFTPEGAPEGIEIAPAAKGYF